MQFSKIFVITTLLFSYLFVTPALAQQQYIVPENALSFFETFLRIPREWLLTDSVLFNLILPLVAIFAILIGFLKTLRIFERVSGIQWVLAAAITFITLPTSAFFVIVNTLLQISAYAAVAAFFALFLGGIFLYTGTSLRRRHWLFQRAGGLKEAYKQSIESIRDEMEQIDDRLVDINTMKLPAALGPPLNEPLYNKLVTERDNLNRKRRELLSQLREFQRLKV